MFPQVVLVRCEWCLVFHNQEPLDLLRCHTPTLDEDLINDGPVTNPQFVGSRMPKELDSLNTLMKASVPIAVEVVIDHLIDLLDEDTIHLFQ